MTGPILNTGGQVLALGGVLILFFYGMPFHVPADGGDVVIANPTAKGKRKESCYRWMGYVGLACILIGTVAQVVANFCPLGYCR